MRIAWSLLLKLSPTAPEVKRTGPPAHGILKFTMQLEAVREVLENFGEVRLAYVFGSVAAGTARTSSDVDVAVLLTPDAGQAVLDRLIDALEPRSRCTKRRTSTTRSGRAVLRDIEVVRHHSRR